MNRQSLDHQVRVELLEEWDQEPGGVLSAVLQSDQCDRNQDAGRPLKAQLGAGSKAEVAAMNNFKVVVGKTDRGEGHRGKHGDPDERIAQVRPEQCRHQNGDGDQQAAHGRSARFFLMRLRSLFADVLPDLEIAQAGNHDRPNDQASKKSGEASERGAESQVTKNTEWRKIMVELQVEQPVEQSASDTSSRFSVLSSQRQGRRECRFWFFSFPPPGAEGTPSFRCHVSSAFSSFTPRDAFNNTTSPSRVSRASHSPASSGVATNSAFIPVSPAASTIGFARPRTPSRKSSLLPARLPAAFAAAFPAMYRPHSRCSCSPVAPSSSISPATTIRRRAGMAARVSTAAISAFGLEL